MSKIWWLLALALVCTGCSALPAEERSFVVAMGVQQSGDTWEVSARMPTYQTGGGYMTASARGTSLEEALALLDATSPMQVHLGQLRMVVFHEGVASSADFRDALDTLARREDFRLHAVICVTDDTVQDLIDKLEPATGSRLSKSLDVLLEARREQGVITAVTLSEIQRMGDRQSPVLTAVALEDDANVAQPGLDASAGAQAAKGAGKVQFGGGWMMHASGGVKGQLTAGEVQLLTLMSGTLRKGMLSLENGTVTVMDATASTSLDGNTAACRLSIRCTASTLTEADVVSGLRKACEGVTAKLAAAGCDALGMGRRAIRHFADMQRWRLLDWPSLYPQIEWDITVHAQQAA